MSARTTWIWLATRAHTGARTHAALLAHFGRIEQIYAADRAALVGTPGLTKLQVDALCDKDTRAAEAIAESCERQGFSVLTFTDAGYPDRLRQIADPPVVLYVCGTLPDLDAVPGIAVVGTRKATPYGLKTALSMAQGLAEVGFVVVTGMALGVDGAANRGALRVGGKTVAVLGGGLDRCYPPSHRQLMGDIRLSGAVLSEYPPGTEPLPQHFPVRNRIISGLCVGTLVVEAGMRSGALITAREALDQGRDVFVVPGNVDMPSFAGSNEMVTRGEAQSVVSPLGIIREYAGLLRQMPDETRVRRAFEKQVGAPPPNDPARWDEILKSVPLPELREPAPREPEPAPIPIPVPPFVMPEHLSDEERTIVRAVREGAGTADEIVEHTGLPAPRVNASITMLELDGVLTRRSGKLVPAEN